MENKATINSLASSMARATGKSKKLCEDFLREFFRLSSEALNADEMLRIKGFGTFKVVEVEPRIGVNISTGQPQEIKAHKKVVFTPSKELAAAINAPFREFESVEIADEIPEDFMEEDIFEENHDLEDEPDTEESEETAAGEENISDENNLNEQILEKGSDEEGEDDALTYEAYNLIEEEKIEKEETEENNEPEATEENKEAENLTIGNNEPEEDTEEPSAAPQAPAFSEEPEYYYEEVPKSRFGIGFLMGALSSLLVCVVIFMLGCFFDWWPVNFGSVQDVQEANIAQEQVLPLPADTETEEAAEETQQDLEPVYDTVSTTRYLTTIAREHYGDFNFWPYIYMENESILGHPDRITPGTRVVVPPLEKYGVDPANKEDVATAKKKGLEIYARFK